MTQRSNVDIAYGHVSGIHRNYPDWPSTFGPCSTDGCDNVGRGAGRCANCHEKLLAKIIGPEKANEMHQLIKKRCDLWGEIAAQIRGNM